MKTIEEKARAYDEALERAKGMRALPADKATVEYIFPELRESEDETHRKWILEYLYDGLRKADEQFKDHFKSAIDWLEKQKPAEWSEEDKSILNNIVAYKVLNIDDLEWLKSLPERFNLPPKQEWSEEDESILEALIYDIERLPVQGVLTHRSCDSYIKFLKALRPGWKPSRAQMSMLLAVINEPNNASSESCHLALAELYEELKKL